MTSKMPYKKNERVGEEMHKLITKLFPICRSITGNGVRESLKIINEHISIEIKEIPTGTKVFDWEIPNEWNINDAYIKNLKGEKIVDFKNSNLHVLHYSTPIKTKIKFKELKEHLYSLPEQPDLIPYLTSFYKENWGFCLTHEELEKMEDEEYEIHIDSKLEKGHLTYGEYKIKGEIDDEVLLSCYICHPSICNDNLSGVSLITFLAKIMSKMKLKYSYRFLFIPETIGAITWLSKNEKNISKIKHGLVATCVGDPGNSTYKKTRDGNSEIDKIVEKVLIESKKPFKILDFWPSGSDERQFSSPGFNLKVGSLMRTVYDKFPEYHTSADNLNFIKDVYLEDSLEKYMNSIFILEHNLTYYNLNPKCEPQLGKRGLYSMIGGKKHERIDKMAIMWVLNLSDGSNSLLDISYRSKINFIEIKKAADILFKNNLLKIV
jgi:aminopeptidase-like protein